MIKYYILLKLMTKIIYLLFIFLFKVLFSFIWINIWKIAMPQNEFEYFENCGFSDIWFIYCI